MDTLFDFLPHNTSKKKKIYVLPCSYEGTVCYGTGTKNGPRAIMEACAQLETFDPELNIALEDYYYFELLPEPPRKVDKVKDYLDGIRQHLKNLNPQKDFLLTLGGEHSITLPLVQFYKQSHPDLVLIQIDAHADLRDEYEQSKYSHACVMARCLELGLSLIQIGIRSCAQQEWELIQSSKQITTFWAWELESAAKIASGCKQIIQNKPCYLTFDADGLDPSILPGVGTPEPQGIYFEWIKNFFLELFPINLIGMDFCELAPIPGTVVSQTTLAKCIFKILMSYSFKQKQRKDSKS